MSRTVDSPKSLFAADRFLSQDACRQLIERIVRLSSGGGGVSLHVRSRWSGNVRWARNEIISAGDITEHEIRVTREHDGASAWMRINRLDDDSLRHALALIERQMRFDSPAEFPIPMRRSETYLEPVLWSDATYGLDAAARADLQRQMVEPAVAQELLSAGYLEVQAVGNGVVNSSGLFAYVPETRAEYSVTVRNATGTGSGWAGVENLDWRKIDASKLSQVAMDKCTRSADPVAIEPGRYTVIMEPQAVSDLMVPLVRSLSRRPAEMGIGPWADRPRGSIGAGIVIGAQGFADDVREAGRGPGNSKIGQRVLDPRISISADPTDAEAPFVPFAYDSTPHRPVTWIDEGVLRELSYDRSYAVQLLNKPDPLNNSNAFRISGGNTAVEDMIARTERGLLVTRLTNVRLVDYDSLLCTGTTSDGLWLIERGEITHPVKNFRFRESPLFVFNRLEALGTPVRTLQYYPAVVPPAMVRDFSMTSLADAV